MRRGEGEREKKRERVLIIPAQTRTGKV